MGNSIYLGGGIKSAFCGGNVKEIHLGTNKLFPSGGGGNVVHIGENDYPFVQIGSLLWTSKNLKEITADSLIRDSEENRYYRNTDAIENIVPLLPSGWRLPTLSDVSSFVSLIGTSNGNKLIDESQGGTNDYGFSALRLGYRINRTDSRQWQEFGDCASFCTSEQSTMDLTIRIYPSSFVQFTINKNFSWNNIRLCKDA